MEYEKVKGDRDIDQFLEAFNIVLKDKKTTNK